MTVNFGSLLFPQLFPYIHHMRRPSMFAWDKLFILRSYFNNMRPLPIHTSTNNLTSLKGLGGRKKNIGVLVDCRCKLCVKLNGGFHCGGSVYKGYYYVLRFDT
jgi:hypothetical protein